LLSVHASNVTRSGISTTFEYRTSGLLMAMSKSFGRD
jgi:hypothetical protein